MVDVRIGEHRVLAHDVHAFQFAGVIDQDVHHDGDLVAGLWLADAVREAPGVGKLLVDALISDLLVTGEDVWETAHVTGALDIVLTTERVHAGTGLAQVAGEHLDVRDRPDVVHADGVLGDAHRVEDGPGPDRAEPLCSGLEVLNRDARDLRDVLKAVVLLHDDLLEFLVVPGPRFDELLILPAVSDDLLHQAV